MVYNRLFIAQRTNSEEQKQLSFFCLFLTLVHRLPFSTKRLNPSFILLVYYALRSSSVTSKRKLLHKKPPVHIRAAASVPFLAALLFRIFFARDFYDKELSYILKEGKNLCVFQQKQVSQAVLSFQL